MRGFVLEIIVFICGAVVMILQLVGSRVLAPYVGTSIVVWTSLIGIILGSLSLGYWWGGRLSDKTPNYRTFSLIIFGAAILIGAVTFVKTPVLEFLRQIIWSIHLNAMAATAILFAPPSVMLGMISPYAVRLKIRDLSTTGTTVGTLYAVSTSGSIAGTFLAGFVLIAMLGSTNILYLLALILVGTSILAYTRGLLAVKIVAMLILLVGMIAANAQASLQRQAGFVDIDTQYNRIWIYTSIDEETERHTRVLVTNPEETQSAMYLDGDDDLVLRYTRFYRLVHHFMPEARRALMIGGAGYSYPKEFLKRFRHATMEVVEIDPKMTELARRYFNLEDDARLVIHHEDGRTFLNRGMGPYDVIFGDAFTSFYSIPYQLTTLEAVRRMHGLLQEEGVVLINIISAIEGDKGKFLRAQYATFRQVFPDVLLFPVNDRHDGMSMQNIMLVALKSGRRYPATNPDAEISDYLSYRWQKEVPGDMPLLKDEFAPVDNYIIDLLVKS